MKSTSNIKISEMVQQAVRSIGPSAERWLADVHTQITTTSEAWDLVLTGQLDHDGMCSIIMTAITSDGRDAILKLSVPHDDARGEAEALRHWDRNGAVGLIRSTPDGFTLLLERCRPGKNLWSISLEEQIDIVSDILPRLWLSAREDISIRNLSDTIDEWEMKMSRDPASFDVPVEIVKRAAHWASTLRESQERVLLHGDLNPGNVLSDKGDTWIAIDPKPWVGDPAFDLAQLLMNWITLYDRSDDETAKAIAGLADQLAGQLAVSNAQILQWAVVKALGWRAGYRNIKVLDAAARMRSP